MKAHTLFFIFLGISLFSGCKIFKNWFAKKASIIKEPTNKNIIKITTPEHFEKEILNSKTPVIVKFETDWCGACKTMAPTYQKSADLFENKIKFSTIDAGKLQKIASQFEIKGVPTFLFFKDGKVVDKVVGGMLEDEFIQKINDFFEKNKK